MTAGSHDPSTAQSPPPVGLEHPAAKLPSAADPPAGRTPAHLEVRHRFDATYVDQMHRLLGPDVANRLAIYRFPEGFRLSVIVPVYNECRTVAAVIDRLIQTGLPLEVLLVDDGSVDGSGTVLDGLARRKLPGGSTIRMLRHPQNRGKGAAIRTALSEATGDVVVIQDADSEYDPMDFRLMLQPLLDDAADVVYGTRYGHHDRQLSPWWHQAVNAGLSWFASVAIGPRLSDVETCYKMTHRRHFETILPELREERFGIEIEITARLAALNAPVHRTPDPLPTSLVRRRQENWMARRRCRHRLHRPVRLVGSLKRRPADHRTRTALGPGAGGANDDLAPQIRLSVSGRQPVGSLRDARGHHTHDRSDGVWDVLRCADRRRRGLDHCHVDAMARSASSRGAQDWIANRTGLMCEIEHYEQPRPGEWLLSGLTLTEPETNQPVANIRRLVVRQHRDRLVLDVSQPELAAASINSWWRLLHDAGLSHRDAATTNVWLDARDLTIQSSDASHSFSEVTGSIAPVGDRVEAAVRLRPAGMPIDHPGIELSAVRQKGSPSTGDSNRPQTSLRISTGELDVSLAAIAVRWPDLRCLGSAATFGGSIEISELTRTGNIDGAGWSLSGARLRDIELARLTERQPHRLSGTAELLIENGRLDSDGTIDFIGEVHATDGIFDADLLPLFTEHLGCEVLRHSASDFRYDQIGVRFNLFASQLELTGTCRSVAGRAAEVAMVADGHAVMTTGPAVLPSAALAYVMAPPHSVAVPIARQTSNLLRVLRAPAAALPSSGPKVRVGSLRQSWR